ncbi:MAG: Single-stranded DNA-specific exonuclease [Candidatus Roizmanbacteria bacterium GW2011_GWA2_36_23]|uniref:Single-stranded-DNA-specific exonuclease RecJ n=1 Tax=Candidatus Roizmanbacteria bacterium GW2011_GWA2_36_23 TaxID=1618480 RepID=A0A0G0ELV0_9BACT|nr:MAG: Single-stranded DNA-specific exonuclease [Candidatus Roizmanbacteria bacterium GW2011_GWA2_36_23]
MQISWKQEIKSVQQITNEEILKLILKNRKIKNINEFLNPSFIDKIHIGNFGDGFKNEVKTTIQLLKKIRKNNETVVVYTDYDADGITGGAILWETLHLLGFKAIPYVPHRKNEGYGFSVKGIDNVKNEFNPALIISVDHGITAKEKVTYAKKLGIPIIITDHHLKPEQIPDDAKAIFHITALSGSGVAYFFSKMIFEEFKFSQPGNIQAQLSENFESYYLALASIGTIADLVPLVGPSRSIVYHGLKEFEHTKRVGLQCILENAGITGKPITTYEIGYIIAPRINAVGRLEHAINALRLLCTKDKAKASGLASHLGLKNRERQDLVEKSVKQALLRLEASEGKPNKIPKLIILYDPDWNEGIIGLIASKMSEKYYRPVIILTKSDGILKGSARSVGEFHITNFLRELKKYLIDIGGHQGAAGFTIEEKKLTEFNTAALGLINKHLEDKDLERKIEADIKIPLSKITLALAKTIEKLQPFGIGNPQPKFYCEGKIIDAKLMGKNNQHLKIYIKDDASFPLEILSFNNGKEFINLSKGKKIEVVISLSVNRWNSKEQLQGILINSICINK